MLSFIMLNFIMLCFNNSKILFCSVSFIRMTLRRVAYNREHLAEWHFKEKKDEFHLFLQANSELPEPLPSFTCTRLSCFQPLFDQLPLVYVQWWPGTNVMKLFYRRKTLIFLIMLSVCPCMPFQISPMFASKAGVHSSGAHHKNSTLILFY